MIVRLFYIKSESESSNEFLPESSSNNNKPQLDLEKHIEILQPLSELERQSENLQDKNLEVAEVKETLERELLLVEELEDYIEQLESVKSKLKLLNVSSIGNFFLTSAVLVAIKATGLLASQSLLINAVFGFEFISLIVSGVIVLATSDYFLSNLIYSNSSNSTLLDRVINEKSKISGYGDELNLKLRELNLSESINNDLSTFDISKTEAFKSIKNNKFPKWLIQLFGAKDTRVQKFIEG